MEKRVSFGIESKKQPLATVSSPDETRNRLSDALDGQIDSATLQGIEAGHINLLRVGTATILCYGFEYQDPDTKEGRPDFILPPPTDLHSLIANKRARLLLTEYLAPELRQNMQRLGALGEVAQQKYNLQLQSPQLKWHTRLTIAEVMTRFCEQSGMRVAVADIADTPLYMIQRSAQETLYFAAAAWCSYQTSDLISAQLLNPEFACLGNVLTTIFGGSLTRKIALEAARTPFPNKLEDVLMYIEDARRHFLAQGIKQLADEYGSGSSGDSGDIDIIVAYPPAHLRRVINHLANPQPWKTVKRHLYRGLQPGLHYSVRTWQHKEGYSATAHWEKISDRVIR